MFGTNCKSSILVLPWLLLPLAVLLFFITVVDPWIQDYGQALRRESSADSFSDAGVDFGSGDFVAEESVEESDELVPYSRWQYSSECFGVSTIIAIAVNLLLLIIIPCAIGGFDGGKKRFEFYLGFFINLAVMIVLPVIYYLFYELDTTTFVILLALHMVSYLATFIIGSRFVSPAYRKAFWFA